MRHKLQRALAAASADVRAVLHRALDRPGRGLGAAESEALLRCRARHDVVAVLAAADEARHAAVGDVATYVVNRNINFTNICYVGCSFCGFARHSDEDEAFDRGHEEILGKCKDAVERGATEVCIQGGIHPGKDHHTYRDILRAIKAVYPDLHIHAYSPEEMDFGHKKSGMELGDYLSWLVGSGLGTMPGTAAEILDDEVRDKLSPNKLKTDRWVEVIKAAHGIGLRSTSTLNLSCRHRLPRSLHALKRWRTVNLRTASRCGISPTLRCEQVVPCAPWSAPSLA